MTAPDRKAKLMGQSQVTGIDFVYVHASQTLVDVFFLNNPLLLTPPLSNLQAAQVLIYDLDRNVPGQEVGIVSLAWVVVDGKNVLRITTAQPGEFHLYKFTLNDARVDRYFNHLQLNFKANCPSDLDCKQPPPDCPPENWVDFPIDYLARDFDSFRKALFDFASLRYPEWTDRLEADAGVMLLEVMSALGDEMSFYQDKVAREAHLETATQRRSVRRHTRFVDYPLHDGLGARSWLDVTVATGKGSATIPYGTDVWAISDSNERILYEVGNGIADIVSSKPPLLAVESLNELLPYRWDEDELCLPAGSTEIHVQGHHESALMPMVGDRVEWVLLKMSASPGKPGKVHLVKLTTVVEGLDVVNANAPYTRLTWSADHATPEDMDLLRLVVRCNIIPIVAGVTHTDRFIVGEDPDLAALTQPNYGTLTRAIERTGPGQVPIYLYSLTGSDATGLVWEGTTPLAATPALVMAPVTYAAGSWTSPPDAGWHWRSSLLGSPSSLPQSEDFTLDDGIWRRVVGYQRPQGMVVHQDYATGAGKTIRFGDGEFGLIPSEGTIFQVSYRLGNGLAGNVEADAITHFNSLTDVEAISNPFTITSGTEEESLAQAKMLAPEAFRAVTYRAVRKEDYAEAAERLPWVQRAGADFRWTGSWLTGFVTPDPLHSTHLQQSQQDQLQLQMDRFRQAGREVYATKPVFADIDLEVDVCLEASAFPAEVKARILIALFGKGGSRPIQGFFSPDRFTFGSPLHRSSLETAIQEVAGVKAVEQIRIRRRGWFKLRVMHEYSYSPGAHAILRISNDPLHPEQGTLKLQTHGGA